MAVRRKHAASEPLPGESLPKRAVLRSTTRAGGPGPALGTSFPTKKKRSAPPAPVPGEPAANPTKKNLRKRPAPPAPVPGEPAAKKKAGPRHRPGRAQYTKVAKGNNKEYVVNINGVPLGFRNKIVDKCSLEFLEGRDFSEEDPETLTNHCIIRLTFRVPIKKYRKFWPANCKGLVINCSYANVPLEVEGVPQGKLFPSRIMIRTFTHDGPHRYARKVVDLPIVQRPSTHNPALSLTVWEFLDAVHDKKMAPAAFTTDGKHKHGCRDFTSQLIQHWITDKVVEPEDPEGGSFWDCFNTVYGPNDLKVQKNVHHAAFTAAYTRVPIPGVNYADDGDPRLDAALLTEQVAERIEELADHDSE